MSYFKGLLGMSVMALGISAAPINAATLNVDGTGQLLGASDVNVGGSLYDVEFLDGTCIALFDGCNEDSDFAFNTAADAALASQALLDLVLVDGVYGSFDSTPHLTSGISYLLFGYLYTPYQLYDNFRVKMSFAVNVRSTEAIPDHTGHNLLVMSDDIAINPRAVFASWTPVAPVPLPAGGLLLLSALGGFAALRRRKKRTA